MPGSKRLSFRVNMFCYCDVLRLCSETVLNHLLFVFCTTPPSTLISSLLKTTTYCANDTQLFSHSILVTLTQLSPTFSTLRKRFPPGCSQIFLLLTLLRLNFSLLVSKGNFTQYHTFCMRLGLIGFMCDKHFAFPDQSSSLSTI